MSASRFRLQLGGAVQPFRAFDHPGYGRVWTGALISSVGTWIERVAVGIYVAQVTGKAGWTGTVQALLFLPVTVMSPIGGALGDRVRLRPYLMGVSAVQMLLASVLAFLALTGRLSVAAVGVLMLLTGSASSLLGPPFNAFLGLIVPRNALSSALFLSSAQFNLARTVGPMVAVLAMALGGLGLAFGLNALSFLAVILAIRSVPSPQPLAQGDDGPLLSGIPGGVRAALAQIWEDRGMRHAVLLAFLTVVCIGPFMGLLPSFAIHVLQAGPAGTSLLVTCQGLGAILAALVSSSFADSVGRGTWLSRSSLVVAPVAALFWLAPSILTASVGVFALGAAYVGVNTSCHATLLGRAPVAARARIGSIYTVMIDGGYSLSLILQAWLADRYGLRLVEICASGLFLFLLWWARRVDPAFFAEFDGPSPVVPPRTVSGENLPV